MTSERDSTENEGSRRRRATDDPAPRETHSAGPGGNESSRTKRRRFYMRFRRPLIGFGLLGIAAPMGRAAHETRGSRSLAEPPQPATGQQDDMLASAVLAGDVEENLADRIGEARADSERHRHVDRAVQRYGIARALAEDIYDIARQEGVEPRVAFGLVNTESTFRERAVSRAGAHGLTQVMPRTARGMAPGTTSQDLFDRKTNLRLGFRYLDQLMKKYRGDVQLALTAYNRGPGTVDRVLASGGNPDNGYAGKVLRG